MNHKPSLVAEAMRKISESRRNRPKPLPIGAPVPEVPDGAVEALFDRLDKMDNGGGCDLVQAILDGRGK